MSLFGTSTTTTSSAAPLFGSTAATAKPLLGGTTTTTATSSVPLFGSTTTPTTTLFGGKPTTGTAPATGGLFGSTTAAAAAPTTSVSSGGLFGAKPATTSSPAVSGGLFGSTPASTSTPFKAAAAAPSNLGLGGVQQNTIATSTSGTVTNSLTGTDSEPAKAVEMQAATFIREMLPLIENKLKMNKDLMEEVETMNVDSSSIDDMLDKSRGWISEVRRNVRSATEASNSVMQLAANDKMLLDTAKRVHDQSTTANQNVHTQFIKKNLAERTNIYDLEMRALQNRVNELRVKFEKLLKGESSLSMHELDDYFMRVDRTAGTAQHYIQKLGVDIEEMRNQLIEQGYTHLRRTSPSYVVNLGNVSEGADFFPSQSSLAVIGSSLRAPASTATTGVLGTGSSLFGSNTGTTSLFGSSTAAKPAFSGGSLFGNQNTTPATSASTSTATTSLFGSKPSTTFASTVSNNSSGLLFSSKK
uniref:Uncharacterized protein n=1 Tax=Caenorhabditis japonica TaxID=281687 RepID=A0A8R1DYF0_CAEJA